MIYILNEESTHTAVCDTKEITMDFKFATLDIDDEYDGPAVGDIVQLASGSPDMTVIDYCDECDDVTVAFYDGSMTVMTLPVEALVEAD